MSEIINNNNFVLPKISIMLFTSFVQGIYKNNPCYMYKPIVVFSLAYVLNCFVTRESTVVTRKLHNVHSLLPEHILLCCTLC